MTATRKPQRTYTEYEIMEVDRLMTKHNGSRATVARELKMDKQRLQNMINLTALKAKWGRPGFGPNAKKSAQRIPQGEAAEIMRMERTKPVGDGAVLACSPTEDPPHTTEKGDAMLVEAIEHEDRRIGMRGGLVKLGKNKKEREFLKKLQAGYTENIRNMMDLTFAGMGHAFTRTLFLYEDILEKIREIDRNPEKFTELTEKGYYSTAHDKRIEYLRMANDYVDQLRKLNGATEKANEMRLQLQKLERENRGDGPRAKPGFKPQVAKLEQHIHYHGKTDGNPDQAK